MNELNASMNIQIILHVYVHVISGFSNELIFSLFAARKTANRRMTLHVDLLDKCWRIANEHDIITIIYLIPEGESTSDAVICAFAFLGKKTVEAD